MREFWGRLWQRLEHIVIDFAQVFALIVALGIISVTLHKTPLPQERVKIIESIHFWFSVVLLLLFGFFTTLNLVKVMWKELTGKQNGGEADVQSSTNR